MAERRRGRPRTFDREAALQKAVEQFWEYGFESTSVADLTAAMGISAPSLYAAFGDKRALFAEVVGVYQSRYGRFLEAALEEEPTSYRVAERCLTEAAREYTTPGRPKGCLIAAAGVNGSEESMDVQDELRQIRNGNVDGFSRRVQFDVDTGVLPMGTNVKALAEYTCAMLLGMSQRARDGASREELEAVAMMALKVWPV